MTGDLFVINTQVTCLKHRTIWYIIELHNCLILQPFTYFRIPKKRKFLLNLTRITQILRNYHMETSNKACKRRNKPQNNWHLVSLIQPIINTKTVKFTNPIWKVIIVRIYHD